MQFVWWPSFGDRKPCKYEELVSCKLTLICATGLSITLFFPGLLTLFGWSHFFKSFLACAFNTRRSVYYVGNHTLFFKVFLHVFFMLEGVCYMYEFGKIMHSILSVCLSSVHYIVPFSGHLYAHSLLVL